MIAMQVGGGPLYILNRALSGTTPVLERARQAAARWKPESPGAAPSAQDQDLSLARYIITEIGGTITYIPVQTPPPPREPGVVY
jgi:hypothetical protein